MVLHGGDMKILVIDAYDRGLSGYFKSKDYTSLNECNITEVNNKCLPDPEGYDLIFLHYGMQPNKEKYLGKYGGDYPITLFSGGGVREDTFQLRLVSIIPWSLNNKDDINSLNWENAFEKFEKGKPFPVHLLKPSLQNAYAFLILLQGTLARMGENQG